MAKIIKKYPIKFNLQLIRYESSSPFQCFRCNNVKISKLQAILLKDHQKVLCNSCYGFIISVMEVKNKLLARNQKIDQIHNLTLKNVSTSKSNISFQNLEKKQKKYTKFLSNNSKRFLGTVECLKDEYKIDEDLDYSALIIELTKAVETEIMNKIIKPLRNKIQNLSLTAEDIDYDCKDKHLSKVSKYVYGDSEILPELGTFTFLLNIVLNSKNRIKKSKLLQNLLSILENSRNSYYFLDKEKCFGDLKEIVINYRNPAAHLDLLDYDTFSKAYEKIVGEDGFLWKLISI